MLRESNGKRRAGSLAAIAAGAPALTENLRRNGGREGGNGQRIRQTALHPLTFATNSRNVRPILPFGVLPSWVTMSACPPFSSPSRSVWERRNLSPRPHSKAAALAA